MLKRLFLHINNMKSSDFGLHLSRTLQTDDKVVLREDNAIVRFTCECLFYNGKMYVNKE